MSFWIKRLKLSADSATYHQSENSHKMCWWASCPHSRLLDFGVAVALILGAFVLYLQTMPPSVLDGDSGRWQYVCDVLGVSYPTGYPGLTLLGKLWALLVPVGTMAYRISLMSVTLGALSAGLTYLLFQKLVGNRSAAVLGAVIFATLSSTWWWSISIKSYALNLVFVSACFLLLLHWAEHRKESALRWFAVMYGLSLTNHSTMVLFGPAFAAYILLTDPAIIRNFRRMGVLLALFSAPLLIYLYVPLRGTALWMAHGTEPGLPWPVSVSRGLISSEYEPSLQGFLNIVLAPHETGSLVSGWGDVPQLLITVYGRLLSAEFGWVYVILGVIGGARLLLKAPKKAALVILGFLAFPPFVVQYGHGMQSAFLLPSNLMFVVGIVSAIAGILDGLDTLTRRTPHLIGLAVHLAIIVLLVVVVVTGAASRYEKMDRSEDYAVHDYWTRILKHPLEENAGILGHSGVLIPMWYFQQLEGQRPDLFGLFPPDEQIVEDWLETGHTLYLAGPLEEWLPKSWERYRLTPWGILVKLAPHSAPNEIETIAPQHKAQVIFGDRLELLGYDLAESAPSGDALSLRLYWRTQAYLPADYLVSLRLVSTAGQRVSLVEDRLVSAWYPEQAVPQGRLILGVYDVPVPAGTLPGRYDVQLVVHHPETGEELRPSGEDSPLSLGQVTVVEPQRPVPEHSRGAINCAPTVFGGEIELVGYSVYPHEVQTGQALTVETLWQARRTLDKDYVILARWLDASGTVRWETTVPSAHPNHPTSSWKAGELVRDWLSLTAPPDLAGGEYTLRMGWADAEGRALPVRRGWWPAGEWLSLGTMRVVDRPHSFDVPSFAFPVGANFSERIRLLGYDLELGSVRPGETLSLTLYWQALSTIDTSYTVFVHLVDGEGQIWAQHDAVPGQGTLPTAGWVEGEIVTDHYELAPGADLPEDDYSLLVGLYDASTGARLPVLPGGEDHVRLTILRPDHGGRE